MKRLLAALVVTAAAPFLASNAYALQKAAPAAADRPAAPGTTVPDAKPHIDIVFCIDCSHSMGPVIETAKRKVWAIVNQVARAKPAPVLRIGLIGYGQGTPPMRWLDLTDDLDEVYRSLMTYTDDSNTGEEFVGTAIHQATTRMRWSEGRQVMRVIYMVGNETARQGPPEMDYAKTAPAAIAKGIQVNAVYCGDYEHDIATPTWREMAKLADGQYMEIAGNGGAVVMATPFDAKLDELNQKLNGTYLAYGAAGRGGQANQVAQDRAAMALAPAVLAERAVAKSATVYSNARWDLVDAVKADKELDVKKLKDEELPETMRKLKPAEREAYVKQKAAERAAVQEEIRKLAAERDAYVKKESAKQGLDENKGFDKAVRETLAKQAKEKGFTFEEK